MHRRHCGCYVVRMQSNNKAIGMQLRLFRFQQRISQYEVGQRTGIPQSRISLIENGYAANQREIAAIKTLIEETLTTVGPKSSS